MNFVFILIIIALFFIFRKERFSLDEDINDRMKAYLKKDRKYINQIDYWSNSPQINLEEAIPVSPITSDDINWSKLNDYEYSQVVGLIQGNYKRDELKSINAG